MNVHDRTMVLAAADLVAPTAVGINNGHDWTMVLAAADFVAPAAVGIAPVYETPIKPQSNI